MLKVQILCGEPDLALNINCRDFSHSHVAARMIVELRRSFWCLGDLRAEYT